MQQTGDSEAGQQGRETLVWASEQFLEDKERIREVKYRKMYGDAGSHFCVPKETVDSDLAAALAAGKEARHPPYVRELYGAVRKRSGAPAH